MKERVIRYMGNLSFRLRLVSTVERADLSEILQFNLTMDIGLKVEYPMVRLVGLSLGKCAFSVMEEHMPMIQLMLFALTNSEKMVLLKV
jgi:hypothetical protein